MSTPVRATPVKGAPLPDSPGTWRHPRIDEISRRRSAATFSEKNVRRIAYNVVFLLAAWVVKMVVKQRINPHILSPANRTYVGWLWLFVQVVPLVQIGLACLPLVRTPDDLSDIPLTDGQRKLLGLPTASAPPTPDAKFSTPPRYSRTPSLAGSVGSRGSYNSSPLSGRGSPIVSGPSPAGSPLFPKSGNSLGGGRRSSFGSSNPFGASSSSNLFSEHGSPSGGKRTSVGLNNKWLYERGRRTSGTTWAH